MVNKLFFANTDPIQDDESCKWTQKGHVRNERGEGMLISAQDQSLRTTKVHQENIRHLRKNVLCHHAGRDEIVSHILQCSGFKLWDAIRYGDMIKLHRRYIGKCAKI